MYMAEDYNSPQSVYWSLKSFLVLALEEDDPFWISEEKPHPLKINSISSTTINLPTNKLIRAPGHILINAPEHHFLLSSGQSTSKRFKGREAKYGKFAYSSAFGFSVPCGSFLEQIAPDSTLAVSLNDGEDDWKTRWDPVNVTTQTLRVDTEDVPTLSSTWRPWKNEKVVIKTTLLPPLRRWPGWHLRVHRVSVPRTYDRDDVIFRFVDGGFAASSQTEHDISIFDKAVRTDLECKRGNARIETGWWKSRSASLVISESGASGIADLTDAWVTKDTNVMKCESSVIRADPNT